MEYWSIMRFFTSWLEFMSVMVFNFTLLRLFQKALYRSLIPRLIFVSLIITVVSFVFQREMVDMGLYNIPAILVTKVIMLMVIFSFTFWLSLLLGMISTLLGIILEISVTVLLGAANVINVTQVSDFDEILIVFFATVLVNLVTIILNWKKYGFSLPDRYIYGKERLFKRKYVIGTIVLIFLAVSECMYLLSAQSVMIQLLMILALYVVLISIVLITYRLNKKLLLERYADLERKNESH